jgi:CheY-like chemotaxis protein
VHRRGERVAVRASRDILSISFGIVALEQLQLPLPALTFSLQIQLTIWGFANVKRKLQILVGEDKMETAAQIIALLSSEFDVIGFVSNGRELIQVALELHPDVIVSDTSMSMLGGLTAINELHATGTNIPVVLTSSVFRYIGISGHPGARVYVDKSDLAEDLILAVRAAKSGQFFTSRSIPFHPPR